MKTFLDDVPVADAGQSLATALDAIRPHCEDRLIIEVLADGSPVPDADLDNPPATEPYAQELRLKTARASAIIGESLLQAADAIDAVNARQEVAAEHLGAGNIEDAMHELRGALDMWGQIRSLIALVLDLPGSPIDAEGMHGAIAELSGILTQLRDALSTQDWPSVSDIVVYDLPPLGEQWREQLRAVARVAADA